MNTPLRRILLFIASLYVAAVQAAPGEEAQSSGETGAPQVSRYGRGYEARQGLDGRAAPPERPERIDRPERAERIERIERPARAERIERIDRGR